MNKNITLLAIALATLAVLSSSQSARAANTTNNYTGSSSGSVLTGSNWSLTHVPTVSEDAVFTATTGIRTFSNGSLTVGSWNVTASSGTFTLRNATNSTTSTLTLGGAGDAGNGVSGTAGDLLYAAGGSTFTITGVNGTAALLNITLGQSGNFDAAGTINVSSVVSGSGFGVTKTGAGLLTLSGANTYTGGTTLSTGTLSINNAGTSSTNSAIGTGTFAINGGTIQNTSGAAISLAATTNNAQTWGGDFTVSVSGAGGIGDLNLGTGAVTLTGNRQILNISGSSTFTVGGAIGDGGNGYSLTRAGSGTGTWVLTGTSTYSGGTTLGAGTTSVSSIGNAGSNGNLGTGGISLGGTGNTATLLYTGAGETTTKVFNLSGTTGGGIIDTTGATGGLILSADLTATGAGTKTLTLRGDTTGNAVNGKIVDNLTGTNNTNLTKSGAGTWTLSGANTYTGLTSVTAGTLAEGSTGSIADASSLTVNGATAIFDLGANHSDSVATVILDGGGAINGTGTSTLTGTSYDFRSGSISAQLAGSGVTLTKSTAGTVVLTGANTFTGATTINASGGTLTAGAANALGGTSGITINSGGILKLADGSTTNHINDSATITLAGGTFNTGGFSEKGSVGMGALSLTSSSVIDLAAGASIINFANSSSQSWSGTLSIYNWTGTATTGGGTDQVIFGIDTSSLTSGQLAAVNFYSDAGSTLLGGGGAAFASSNNGEIVPTIAAVPEPSTWVAGALALCAMAYFQRRRIAHKAIVTA